MLTIGTTGIDLAAEKSEEFKEMPSKKTIRTKRALRIFPYPVMVKVIGAETTEPYC